MFVDQYSGKVLGTVNRGVDFLGFIHQLHIRLGCQIKVGNSAKSR